MTLTRRRTDKNGAKTKELIEKRETITTRIMDRQLRKEIREDVLEALKAGLAQMQERWISGQELCQQFQMFSPKWLKTYGDVLPRRRVTVTGLDGVAHSSHWAYAQHEIALNIANGMYDDLKVLR